jgi:hypothetical protein
VRAAQSKGQVDLAAFWPVTRVEGRWPWLVQCKTGTARMSREAKQALVQLALETDAVAVLAEPGKNGRGVVFTDLHTEMEITL